MIGSFLQITYQLGATMTEWFLGVGTAFFSGLSGWMSTWFK